MRDDVYYVKLTKHGIMMPTGPDLVFSRSDAQSPASPLQRPSATTYGQSRYQDFHRFRRPALSQQDARIAVHCSRCFRCRDDVMLSVWQAPSAQSAEIAPLARQGSVCLLTQLQGSRQRRWRQALSDSQHGVAARLLLCAVGAKLGYWAQSLAIGRTRRRHWRNDRPGGR